MLSKYRFIRRKKKLCTYQYEYDKRKKTEELNITCREEYLYELSLEVKKI